MLVTLNTTSSPFSRLTLTDRGTEVGISFTVDDGVVVVVDDEVLDILSFDSLSGVRVIGLADLLLGTGETANLPRSLTLAEDCSTTVTGNALLTFGVSSGFTFWTLNLPFKPSLLEEPGSHGGEKGRCRSGVLSSGFPDCISGASMISGLKLGTGGFCVSQTLLHDKSLPDKLLTDEMLSCALASSDS